jgi:uncharacterized protein (DUF1778 family)
MSPEAQRTARVEARIAPDVLELIRRAAELQGRSISDFMVAAAELLRLSRQAQEKFAALILDPPEPTAALVRAFERHRALIGK